MDKSFLVRLVGFPATLLHGDTLVLENIRKSIQNGTPVVLKNETKNESYPLCSEFSDRQRAMLLAGGLLNYTKENA